MMTRLRVKGSCYLKTSRRGPQRPAAWSCCGLYVRGCGGNSRRSSSRLPWSSHRAGVAFKPMCMRLWQEGRNSARFWFGSARVGFFNTSQQRSCKSAALICSSFSYSCRASFLLPFITAPSNKDHLGSSPLRPDGGSDQTHLSLGVGGCCSHNISRDYTKLWFIYFKDLNFLRVGFSIISHQTASFPTFSILWKTTSPWDT